MQEACLVGNNTYIVAWLPQSINTLIGSVRYDHCYPTTLVVLSKSSKKVADDKKYGEEKELKYKNILEDTSTSSAPLL